MTGLDEEFRRKLLTTFREEAEEHLGVITDLLIRIEKSGPPPAPDLVEQVYRKTHSLKGAARAVSQNEVAQVCQNIENIFALVKAGELNPDADNFDLFHRAVKCIGALVSGEKTQACAPWEVIQEIRELLNRYKKTIPPASRYQVPEPKPFIVNPGIPAASGAPPERNPVKEGPSGTNGRPLSVPAPDSLTSHEPESPGPKASWPAPDGALVKIASHKLDRLITQSEDLLTTRLFITQRIQELEEMVSRFSQWRWNQTMVSSDIHRIREVLNGMEKAAIPASLIQPLRQIVAFLEYDREFVTYLQHDLAAHIRATDMDRLALEVSTSEISDLIHDAVLVPVSIILTPFPAFVREYSRTSGKEVDFLVESERIEMDRRILEELKDPLMHLIHNSIDHGIEFPDIRAARNKPVRGTVRIRFLTLSGSRIGIEVSDDGAGIDCNAVRRAAVTKGLISEEEAARITDDEAIWLIFRSGLSTNPIVTDLSGRGLGLAIVEDTVTRLNGSVTVSSIIGKGTRVTLQVPMRLVTVRGIVIREGGRYFVFPKQQVKKVIRIRPTDLQKRGDRQFIRHQEETIEVIRLSDVLGIVSPPDKSENSNLLPAVILSYGAGQITCIVDEVVWVQEIVVRPLGSQLPRVKRISGAVILGNGRVALVLDPVELIQAAIKSPRESRSYKPERISSRILVVEDSGTSRALLKALLEQDGYTVQTAVDGMAAFALLRKHEFDMVVSDVDMPRMSGFTLTEKIRSESSLAKIPVVLVTSLDSRADQVHGISVGADAYLVKSSFEKGNFLGVIRDLLEARR
ncbi:MAG: response regulator [Methanoregulaceae archaeon]